MVSTEDLKVASLLASESKNGDGSGEKELPEIRAKCELVDFHSLPDYLKDNEFILNHYRCEWPMKETILSIFSIHNETLNIWTHLIGFVIFLALAISTAMMIPKYSTNVSALQHSMDPVMGIDLPDIGIELAAPDRHGDLYSSLQQSGEPMQSSSSTWSLEDLLFGCLRTSPAGSDNRTAQCILSKMKEDVTNIVSPLLMKPITRLPFFAFLSGAMFCLLTSSICHLICCHSEKMAYIMLRLDYTGIAALIVTSFYPPVYYTFMCDPLLCNIYMGFITAFGIATVLASLVPVFQTAEYRSVRAALFFCMGVCGVVPIMHKLVVFNDRPEAILSAQYELLMGIFYGLGVVVYATRVPESWMPGMFDLVGHSHQLFHLLVIAGAYAHYLAGLVYLRWRDMESC